VNNVEAYVALGANLGNPVRMLEDAIVELSNLPQTSVIKASSFYRTAPVESSGPDYVNAVVQLQTSLLAPSLLQWLQSLETNAGRERPYVNAPRTLDLDLLLYGQSSIQSPFLTVPHPRMWQRAFVLYPLHEINPLLVSEVNLKSCANQAIQRLKHVD
jgi:2-amino-4-hydroxy-6-hydroxymethyldihydropteridine diphosphokinase